jgi:hypothetical protein
VIARSPDAVPGLVAQAVGAPRELDVLLRDALTRDPSRRPRTALELANRIDGIRLRLDEGELEGEPSSVWTRRALAGLGVTTFAVFALATWLTLRLLG